MASFVWQKWAPPMHDGHCRTNWEYRFRIEFTKIYGIPSTLCALCLPRSLVTTGQLNSHTVHSRYLFRNGEIIQHWPSINSDKLLFVLITCRLHLYCGRFHIVAGITKILIENMLLHDAFRISRRIKSARSVTIVVMDDERGNIQTNAKAWIPVEKYKLRTNSLSVPWIDIIFVQFIQTK